MEILPICLIGIYKLGLVPLWGLITLHKVFPRTYLIMLRVPATELKVYVVRKGYSEKKKLPA